MKKTIFKALAATAVVGTVIAMSGVVASAALVDGPAQPITDKASVNFSNEELFSAAATNNGKAFNGYFEIVDASAKAKITGNEKELGAFSGESKFTKRYQFGGNIDLKKGNCAIKFTVSGPATIQVSACTGSNDATDREVAIFSYDSDTQTSTTLAHKPLGAVEDPADPTKKNAVIDTLTYTTDTPGTYYIGDINGAVNLYHISVSVGGSEVGTNSKIIYNGTDAYALIAVNADELQSLAKVGIGFAKNGTTTLIGEATDKVYETVTIDDTVFKGSDIVEGAEYIYGLKLTDASSDNFAAHSATPARYEE